MNCYNNCMSKLLNCNQQQRKQQEFKNSEEDFEILKEEYSIPTTSSSTKMPTSDTETILALKSLLKDKIEEIKIKDETISLLEKELDEKDAQIFYLKNEIDKFRQVVRPLTQKIITKQITLTDEPLELLQKSFVNEDEEGGILILNEPRIKRQAISAEPIRNDENQIMHIVKIPKSHR